MRIACLDSQSNLWKAKGGNKGLLIDSLMIQILVMMNSDEDYSPIQKLVTNLDSD